MTLIYDYTKLNLPHFFSLRESGVTSFETDCDPDVRVRTPVSEMDMGYKYITVVILHTDWICCRGRSVPL